MKVLVDTERCISAGQCVLSAPNVFDQRDEDGIVVLLDDSPPVDELRQVQQAARVCPAGVITVEVP